MIELLGARDFGCEQLFRAIELRLGEHLRRLALLPCGDARPNERDLVVHVFDRVLQFEAQAARLPDLAAHRGLGRYQLRLRGIDRRLFDRDLHAIRLGVELDQHVAFLHAVVVVDEDARDLARDARRDKSYVAIHISVISRDRVPGVKSFRDYEQQEQRPGDDDQRLAPASDPPRWRRDRCLCRRRRGIRFRFFRHGASREIAARLKTATAEERAPKVKYFCNKFARPRVTGHPLGETLIVTTDPS